MFASNRVDEILNTTEVSQWKHVSDINNQANNGPRVINIGEQHWGKKVQFRMKKKTTEVKISNHIADLKQKFRSYTKNSHGQYGSLLCISLANSNISGSMVARQPAKPKNVQMWKPKNVRMFKSGASLSSTSVATGNRGCRAPEKNGF